MSPNLLVILGATATGKTRLAVGAARALNGEIISADSRQVFRRMDIGTGKDLAEYGAVPYHLIDILDPGAEFSVFDFQRAFRIAFDEIRQRGRLPVLAGGTGLYLDAVLRGYHLVEVPENPDLRRALSGLDLMELRARLLALKPAQHNTTDLNERERLVRAIEIALGEQAARGAVLPLPVLQPLVFGVRWERPALRQRIAERLRQRLEQGLIEEVQDLHRSGLDWQRLERYGLEYRLVAEFLQERLSREDLIRQLTTAIQQFAKRQETWFRRMERQGVEIHWLDGAGDALVELLAAWQSA